MSKVQYNWRAFADPEIPKGVGGPKKSFEKQKQKVAKLIKYSENVVSILSRKEGARHRR